MVQPNVCFYCDGKFGMVRHRRLGKTFCKMKCLDDYRFGKPPSKQIELPLYKPPEDELTTLLRYP